MAEPARRFTLACAIGAGVSLAVALWFLCTSPHGFFGTTPYGLGGFYDAQARALFHGHWNAGPNSFFVERLNLDGKYYMYFGPWPSFLRMPLMLFTSRLDGKLTSASIVLADVTLLAATGRLLWLVRSTSRAGKELSRREQIGVVGFMVLVGCGSTVVFLSASAWVYDEAVLWGAAWAVWSLCFAITYIRAPARGPLILAAATTTLAILSRVSSGVIGVIVLGSLFALQFLRSRSLPRLRDLGARVARLAGIDDHLAAPRRPWATGLAAFTPVLALAAVNWAKFGALFNVPFEKQDLILRTIPARHLVLAKNGNSLVALRELPTNLLHYFRPDGFTTNGLFPFIDFSRAPTIVGNVARDPEGLTASLIVTTTLLLGLAVVGLAVIFIPRIVRRADLDGTRILRLPILAAGIAFGPTLIFPAVSERYKVDLTPALVLGGGVGIYALAELTRALAVPRRFLVGGAAVLMAFNVWANLALTLDFQRGYQTLESATTRASYVSDEITWTKRLGLTPSADVVRWVSGSGTKQPPPGPVGSFLAIDDCAHLMLSDGHEWLDLALEDPQKTCRALGH